MSALYLYSKQSKRDSFFSLAFTDDPTYVKTDFAPIGTLKAALLADKHLSIAKWMSPEEKEHQLEVMFKDGIGASLNWYKIMTNGMDVEDAKGMLSVLFCLFYTWTKT